MSFLLCFNYTILAGEHSPDPNYPGSRVKIEYIYTGHADVLGVPTLSPQTATAYVDVAGGFVWSFFTTKSSAFPDGNNWNDCAGNGGVV